MCFTYGAYTIAWIEFETDWARVLVFWASHNYDALALHELKYRPQLGFEPENAVNRPERS